VNNQDWPLSLEISLSLNTPSENNKEVPIFICKISYAVWLDEKVDTTSSNFKEVLGTVQILSWPYSRMTILNTLQSYGLPKLTLPLGVREPPQEPQQPHTN
jgi:hypothetical protein